MMQMEGTSLRSESSPKQLGIYFAKAIPLVVIVYLASLALPAMSSPAVALFWVAFTLISMLGILYQASISKANRQQKFIAGGIAARINNGRSVRLIISFILSAWLMASLLLESPKWDTAEWALILAAIVVYPLAKFVIRKRTVHEYEPIFETAGTISWASITTALLLCIGYAAYSAFGFGAEQSQLDSTIFDALVATPQPFENASSALLQEAGIGTWISDSIIHYGIAQLSKMPWQICIAIRAILCASAFFGIANLLGVCSLSSTELRKAFIPTDAIKNSDIQEPVRKCYLVWTIILSALLAISFLWGDAQVAKAMQTENGTALQSLARQLAGKSVYIIDGKYYEQAKIDALNSSLTADQAHFHDMGLDLKDSMRNTYEALNENIDSFLDWYFSIATDGSVRSSISDNGVRQAFESHFYAIVAADEDEQITQKAKDYIKAASDLKTKLDDGYRQAEVCDENYATLPDWFVKSKEFTDTSVLNSYRQQAEIVLDAARDSGLISAFDKGDSLLEYQFKSYVYENDPFKTWVEKTDNALKGDIPSNIDSFLSSVFQKDNYHSGIKEQLGKCQREAEALVEENAILGW